MTSPFGSGEFAFGASPMQETMMLLHEVWLTAKAAGFTEDQAMEIVKAMMVSAVSEAADDVRGENGTL